MYVAQRYDILVNATAKPGNYWIRANTLSDQFNDKEQILAVLRYDVSSVPIPSDGENDPTTHRWGEDATQLTLFTHYIPLNASIVPNATKFINVGFNCSEEEYHCSMNGTQFEMPMYPVGLAIYEDRPVTTDGIIISINDGDVVMFVLNNDGNMSHPFHLHGHQFWVLGNGNESSGHFNGDMSLLNFVNPTLRDTQQIQAFGWMVLLFEADNPGVWFFHCHIEWHMEAGLALVFNESKALINPPPMDLPYYTTYGAVYSNLYPTAHPTSPPTSGGGVNLIFNLQLSVIVIISLLVLLV